MKFSCFGFQVRVRRRHWVFAGLHRGDWSGYLPDPVANAQVIFAWHRIPKL
jgi:hypothetical protein